METAEINNSSKKVGRERKDSDSLVAQGVLKADGKEPKEVSLNWWRLSLILGRSEGMVEGTRRWV